MDETHQSHDEPDNTPVDKLARLLALAAAIAIMLTAASVTADVLGRWLFNRPLAWVSDLNRYNYAVALAGFFPLCMAERRFIDVRFVGQFFGPPVARVLDVFADVCTLAVFCAIAWQFTRYTIRTFGNGLSSLLLLIPQWPWWAATTIIVYFCVVVQAVVLLRTIKRGASDDGAELV